MTRDDITKRKSRRDAFTLIEILVSIGIISVLVALLLPAVQQAREAARRLECRNNLKQVALALHNYHDVNTVFPPGGFPTGSYRMGWAVRLLPFIEQQPRYDQILALKPNALMKLAPWRYEGSTGYGTDPVWTDPIPIYACPSSPLGERSPDITNYPTQNPWVVQQAALHYRANGGSRLSDFIPGPTDRGYTTSGVIYPESKVAIGDIRDGSSNTLLLGETSDSTGWPGFQRTSWCGINPWTWGYFYNRQGYLMIDHKYVEHPIGYSGAFVVNATPFRSAHAGRGASMALSDGSVRYMSSSMSLDVLQSLATRNGGEVVSLE